MTVRHYAVEAVLRDRLPDGTKDLGNLSDAILKALDALDEDKEEIERMILRSVMILSRDMEQPEEAFERIMLKGKVAGLRLALSHVRLYYAKKGKK